MDKEFVYHHSKYVSQHVCYVIVTSVERYLQYFWCHRSRRNSYLCYALRRYCFPYFRWYLESKDFEKICNCVISCEENVFNSVV